ncbi:MAG: ribonuclease P protein component 4 [Candidatus Methanomethylophilus sp.]|nr:ribonuclease P protein component 4 [Methanomethylophilus sp.]MDD3233359.1 ribonuclease P protein component 4 [Methanomethylophilus sp.]MDD4221700.1 ribonuclease P protein component 4 [Methanomethylophilus sp.]MDD4668272.1 ribonuclease P protein component 4 [Methanomethylophilus sp.]
MAKRHLSRNAVRDIGTARVETLLRLSQEAVRAGRGDRARRYVGLARTIGMKAQVSLPPDFRYCRRCLLPLIPGLNCTVRLTGHKVVCGCRECGAVRRRPYLKEQKNHD